MVQATASFSPRQTREDPVDGVMECSCDGQHLEAGTLVEPIRVRTAPDLGLESWGNSATPEHAELFLDLHRSDPEMAHRLARAVTTMPEVGTE